MKRIFLSMVLILLVGLPASAQKDENNRIKNAGKVMVEILNVPDDIPRSSGQGGMRHRSAFGDEICDRVWGQLRSRRDDLPERQGFQRTLECAFHDGARRWKLRPAVGRPSDRLCLVGNESARG